MLAKTGIIDKESAKQIFDGLAYVGKTLKVGDLSGKYEDLYFNVEKALFAKIGKVGGKLHAGRSRNDIHATMARMEVRKTVWTILREISAFQALLIRKAEENKDAVLTGYTHFQPGQPITLAHYYMAVCIALARDYERIRQAYATLNLSPYGAAAFAGSSFPVDRQLLCDLLGFDQVMENSLDCIASRDYVLQLLSAYAIMATNISRVAEDLYFWATFENGILDIGGEIAICSSIMPQKKNPVSLEYARSKAAHTIGTAVSSMTVLKGAPFSNNMDIFEAPTLYWEGLNQLRQSLTSLSLTVEHSQLRRDVATRKAGENFCTVTSLADYMVKHHGLSFVEAHHIVGNIVAIIIENGSGIPGITPELLKVQSQEVLGYSLELSAEQIAGVLDPFNNVQTKQGIGGPSIESVTRMLTNARATLEAEVSWLEQAEQKVQSAYQRLESESF
jgi:argininosuccinate lyase